MHEKSMNALTKQYNLLKQSSKVRLKLTLKKKKNHKNQEGFWMLFSFFTTEPLVQIISLIYKA